MSMSVGSMTFPDWSSLDAETSSLGAATSAIARSYQRYRCGVSGDCGVGITPQMCNRVTNHGDMSTFSKPDDQCRCGRCPFGNCLPGTELLQSPFKTDFSMGSLSRRCRRSMRRHRRFLRSYRQSLQSYLLIADPLLIMEEILTSGKYVSLFLISILYRYI